MCVRTWKGKLTPLGLRGRLSLLRLRGSLRCRLLLGLLRRLLRLQLRGGLRQAKHNARGPRTVRRGLDAAGNGERTCCAAAAACAAAAGSASCALTPWAAARTSSSMAAHTILGSRTPDRGRIVKGVDDAPDVRCSQSRASMLEQRWCGHHTPRGALELGWRMVAPRGVRFTPDASRRRAPWCKNTKPSKLNAHGLKTTNQTTGIGFLLMRA